MKIKKLIEELKKYDDDVDIFFYLTPKDDIGDDSQDVSLEWIGEICTSGLDSDYPCLDIGLTKSN